MSIKVEPTVGFLGFIGGSRRLTAPSGGALRSADSDAGVTFGYVMNRVIPP
jgi:hypothetical protein